MSGKIEIILIGKTGSGKSQLGNFWLGEKVFEVSVNPAPKTTEILKRTKDNLSIIDTPGLQDSNRIGIIEYIKKSKNLNGILIVINCQEPHFSEDIQNMIRLICIVFYCETYKNIGLVYTKFYGKKKEKEKIYNNKMDFTYQTKELVEKFYGRKLENILEAFFIDSDMDEIDEDSLKTRYNILLWMRKLKYINYQELHKVKDIKYKKKYIRYDSKITKEIDSDYIIETTIKLQRLYAIDLNDKEIGIGEWEEIAREVVKTPIKK